MIYLECNYDEVIDRIIERGREMEINTDPEYWKKLYIIFINVDTYNWTCIKAVNPIVITFK
jgi:deoxyadenosine/deoxycytidine kinase